MIDQPNAPDETQVFTAAGATQTCPRCQTEFDGGDSCPFCGTLVTPAPCQQHPSTSASGRCVICGTTVCPECSLASEEPYLCETHAGIAVFEGWAQAYAAEGELDARLTSDNLRAAGIDAQVFSQTSHVYPVRFGDLNVVRVMVPAWQYTAAVALLQEAEREAPDAGTELCAGCGGEIPAGAETCPHCGASTAGV